MGNDLEDISIFEHSILWRFHGPSRGRLKEQVVIPEAGAKPQLIVDES